MLTFRQRLGHGIIAIVAAGAILATPIVPAHAQSDVHIIAAFDESAGQNTEGVALDRSGNVFVSVSPLGDLWKFPAGSMQPQPFGHVNGIVPGQDFGMLGLAVDLSGNVYAGVQAADPDVNGVWRFDHRTGDATHLPGSESIGIPNGLAFDFNENLYVADSTGAIWRIRPGGAAKIWLHDPALTGDGSLHLFLGANGIAFRRHVFTVTNTERRTILQIRKMDGHPGPIDTLTTLPEGDNPDGVAMDVHGNAFVAMNLANAIARVSTGGSLDVRASGDPLDFPSSVAFGTTSGERSRLFGVNFSIGEMFGQPPGFGPAVWWLRAGARGVLVP
jgi:sugar lactone lactonase YvrE